MTPLCDRCSLGPAGIEGHGGLRAASLGVGAMTFKCAGCQSLWSRSYSSAGDYFWLHCLQAGPGAGPSLPQRPMDTGNTTARLPGPAGSTAEHWLAIQLSWKRPQRGG